MTAVILFIEDAVSVGVGVKAVHDAVFIQVPVRIVDFPVAVVIDSVAYLLGRGLSSARTEAIILTHPLALAGADVVGYPAVCRCACVDGALATLAFPGVGNAETEFAAVEFSFLTAISRGAIFIVVTIGAAK